MIDIRDLSAGYPEKEVLKGINLRICEEDFAVILGPNGVGKSTLLYALIGILPITGGDILINGTSLKDWHRAELARQIALIPQETVFTYDNSVENIVLMGRFPWLRMLQNYSPNDREIAHRIMAQLELTDLKDRYFSRLSGGEKQRVLLARALTQDTKDILLDESLSQLDLNHQIEMMHLLTKINRTEKKCIVLISHHINLAANFCSKMIFLKDGKEAACGTPEEMLTSRTISEIFNVAVPMQTNPLSGRPNIVYPGKG